MRSRYAVYSLEDYHTALDDAVASGRARRLAVRSEPDGRWWRVEVEIEGGDGSARVVLAGLIKAGMPVARFERVISPLGDLIERAIARSGRR